MVEEYERFRIFFKTSISKKSFFSNSHPVRLECRLEILKNIIQAAKTLF